MPTTYSLSVLNEQNRHPLKIVYFSCFGGLGCLPIKLEAGKDYSSVDLCNSKALRDFFVKVGIKDSMNTEIYRIDRLTVVEV